LTVGPFRRALTRPAHRRSSSEGRTSMNTSTAFWFLVVIAPGHMQHTRLQAAGVVQHLPGKRPKRLALTTKSGSPAAADSAEWVRRSAEPAGHQGEADMAAWATRLSGLLQTTGQPLPMLQQLFPGCATRTHLWLWAPPLRGRRARQLTLGTSKLGPACRRTGWRPCQQPRKPERPCATPTMHQTVACK
jgi:hypothetical protein